ncbi:hypothetical protein NC652_032298 [Populus alba x Populus x berolinensis]|nr:hypothetical protein NC652_032298 [Populus alba x Populus x berolinensis]
MVDEGKFWPFGWRCYPLLVSLFHWAGSVFSHVLIEFVTMNMPGFGRCGESLHPHPHPKSHSGFSINTQKVQETFHGHRGYISSKDEITSGSADRESQVEWTSLMLCIYFMTLIYFVFAILGSPAHWPNVEKGKFVARCQSHLSEEGTPCRWTQPDHKDPVGLEMTCLDLRPSIHL